MDRRSSIFPRLEQFGDERNGAAFSFHGPGECAEGPGVLLADLHQREYAPLFGKIWTGRPLFSGAIRALGPGIVRPSRTKVVKFPDKNPASGVCNGAGGTLHQ